MTGVLPSGQVTFAFVDVVGSTRMFAAHGEAFAAALKSWQEWIARTAEEHDGCLVRTAGDGAFLAFAEPTAAVGWLQAVQQPPQPGPEGLVLHMRAGAHTGDAVVAGDDYISYAVHVAARVSSAAGAGQTFVSQELIDALPAEVGEPVGDYELKDIAEPVTLWRITGEGRPEGGRPARHTNAVPSRTSFIGREADLAWLCAAVAEPGAFTVAGPGGVGKTRLVTELALAQADERRGGAWLVELATIESDSDVSVAVASVLDPSRTTSTASLAAELSRRGDALVILDNCEHVLDGAAEFVSDVLETCPELRVVCTSREPLAVPGERVRRLAPLAVGTDDIEPGPAELLFIDRALAAGASITPIQWPAVSRVCQSLDGIPMALELAAVNAASLTLDQLAEALEKDEIDLRRRGGVERQRSIGALVDWSLRRLSEGERRAALTISVLPAAFSDELGATLAGDNPAVLQALVRNSLVDLDGARYRMLAPVRRASRRRLREDPGLEGDAHSRLVAWCTELEPVREDDASRIDRDLFLAIEEGSLWALAHELPGRGVLVRAAVQWTVEFLPSERLSRVCLDIAQSGVLATDGDSALVLIAALRQQTSAYAPRDEGGNWPRERVDAILETARRTLSGNQLGFCLGMAGLQRQMTQDHNGATLLFQEALAVPGITPSQRGTFLGNIGVTLHFAGALEAAEPYYRAALSSTARTAYLALHTANFAELLLDRGEPEAALEVLEPRREWFWLPGVRSAPLPALYLEALVRLGRSDNLGALAALARQRLVDSLAAERGLQAYLDRLDAVVADIVG